MYTPTITVEQAKIKYFQLINTLTAEIENRLMELGRVFILPAGGFDLEGTEDTVMSIELAGSVYVKCQGDLGGIGTRGLNFITAYDCIMILEELEVGSVELPIGTSVMVPDPELTDDNWENEFVGTVKAYRDKNMVTVEDGEGDCFDVELERLTEYNED